MAHDVERTIQVPDGTDQGNSGPATTPLRQLALPGAVSFLFTPLPPLPHKHPYPASVLIIGRIAV